METHNHPLPLPENLPRAKNLLHEIPVIHAICSKKPLREIRAIRAICGKTIIHEIRAIRAIRGQTLFVKSAQSVQSVAKPSS